MLRSAAVVTDRVPHVSFVIPVFDEEPILFAAILELRENLGPLGLDYEVVLAENG